MWKIENIAPIKMLKASPEIDLYLFGINYLRVGFLHFYLDLSDHFAILAGRFSSINAFSVVLLFL